MPQYKNYEIQFDESIEWDYDNIKVCLADFDCLCVFINNASKHTVIIKAYRPYNIIGILNVLYDIYIVDMKYREFNVSKWKKYQQNNPVLKFTIPVNIYPFQKNQSTLLYEVPI